jgi:two-component system, cell cycle response regulator
MNHVYLPPMAAGRVDTRELILLVEETAFRAEMLEGMLKAGGLDVNVHHASSLAEAQAIVGSDIRVSCIVLDLSLPDTRGLDGVVDICQLAPEVPIIVVTADDDEARAVKAVQLGAQDYLTKGRLDPHLLRRSIRYAIERKRAELQLSQQALHDPLTGLPNRTLLDDRLQLALAQSARQRSMVGVMFCDLDRFKQVNDTYGHAAGDRVLRATAGRLITCVRAGDTVARYGGDEFAVISAGLESEDVAIQVALRLRAAIADPFPVAGGAEVEISTSVGVALASGIAWRPREVVDAADGAMYRAKRNGDAYELVRL